MYDELVNQLRGQAVCADSGNEIGNSMYLNILKAADVIEELSELADAIPHICECCVGCEVESRGCDQGFVLSPKRAKEYIIGMQKKYDEVLKAAKKMHTWIFLNSVDEQAAYDECGLTDEMNAALGYCGQYIMELPKEK